MAQPATDNIAARIESTQEAPRPGSQKMPAWKTGELIDAPRFTWRNWAAMIGPGLVAGGAAIGGGEWLLGPIVTAQYGGAMMWLALISILGQVIYNIEISRYTLYSGEPIFTGKFRTLPGPGFWLCVYLVLDFGAVFPYLASNAATPLGALMIGQIPTPLTNNNHWWLLKILGYVIFLGCLVPLLVGGKVYNSLKAVMMFKIVFVFGFLVVLGIFFSKPATWVDIFSGFLKVGNVPVRRGEDLNGNGVLDPGEDWDGDGHLDVVETGYPATIDTNDDGKPDAWEDRTGDGAPDKFEDVDGDGIRDGSNVDNVFVALWQGRPLPIVDLTLIATLAGFVAIAGQGGLSNTPISNYTRDQGWGMGWQVGAIPAVFGGRNIKLSHVGTVFHVDEESLPRWRRWYRHVARDQLAVWMPACLLGVALPSMLSVEFLRRGVEASSWTAAGMTADGVHARVSEVSGMTMGSIFWHLTLFCGFVVLSTSMISTADGLVRRWVDVFWTSSPRLRRWKPEDMRILYFLVLASWGGFSMVMLALDPKQLVEYATMVLNFALGFSCWHTLAINLCLLPKPLRPGWFVRIALALAGLFFWVLATVTALSKLGLIAS